MNTKHPPFDLKAALTADKLEWLGNICEEQKFIQELNTTYLMAFEMAFGYSNFPSRGNLKRKAEHLSKIISELRTDLVNVSGRALLSYVFGKGDVAQLQEIFDDRIIMLGVLSERLGGSGGHTNDAAHIIAHFTLVTFSELKVHISGNDGSDYVRVVELLMKTLGIDGSPRHYSAVAIRAYKESGGAPDEMLVSLLKSFVPRNALGRGRV